MTSELKTLFQQVLAASEELRPGYIVSLGSATPDPMPYFNDLNKPFTADLLDIYSLVRGTPAEISAQRLMDFIPGYRLVEASEAASGTRWDDSHVTPLLSNYSSDHIGYLEDSPSLWRLNHDDFETYKIFSSSKSLMQSIIECYRQGAYFLDSSGYLDWDVERTTEICAQLNPDAEYWA